MENELMQENQITNAIQQIEVVQGSVVFGAYEDLKKQAIELAEQIKSVEVDEENIKLSKKLLATVNKRLKELDDKRISIKKTMLEPYQGFENQVKEILTIVKDADAIVRDQVNTLEEKERSQKFFILEDIFNKRKKLYSFGDLITFEGDFMMPKYLNKSVSIDSIEKEMVVYFEQFEKDLNVIKQMDDSGDLLKQYLFTNDLAEAINGWKQEKEKKDQINQAIKKKPTTEQIAFLVSVQVQNEKELKLLEMILKEHQFEYTTDKVVL